MLLPRRPKKDDGRGLVLAAAALQDHISRSYKLSNPPPVRKAPVAACSRCGHLPSNEGRRTLPTLSDGLLTGKCKYKACNPMYVKLATTAVQQLFAALAIYPTLMSRVCACVRARVHMRVCGQSLVCLYVQHESQRVDM